MMADTLRNRRAESALADAIIQCLYSAPPDHWSGANVLLALLTQEIAFLPDALRERMMADIEGGALGPASGTWKRECAHSPLSQKNGSHLRFRACTVDDGALESGAKLLIHAHKRLARPSLTISSPGCSNASLPWR